MSTYALRPRSDVQTVGARTSRLVGTIGIMLTLGMITISIFLAFGGPAVQGVQVGSALTSFLVYTSALSAGIFLGFLFGLPRSRAIEQLTESGRILALEGKETALTTQFLANSNLIKVSDWLTTIVIGLTLVNLGDMLPTLRKFADFLSAPLGGQPYSGAIGVAIAVGSAFAGFILGYIWTSIQVRQLLEEAEMVANGVNTFAFTDMTLVEARSLAEELHLRLLEPSNAQDASVVVGQDPGPGTKLRYGDVVRVIIKPHE
jgi:hypothetical protein